MASSENILESILEEEEEEIFEDVDMIDAEAIEDGEIISPDDDKQQQQHCIESSDKQENPKAKPKRKKKNKRRRKPKTVTTITDVNRFVIDTCRRLKEKKQYLLWNAVGTLGVAAVSDIVKEVDAIQACGGQMTADGKRHRYGGGILWNILKTREPNAYKEIMTKGKEFERSFRRPNSRKGTIKPKDTAPSEIIGGAPSGQIEDETLHPSEHTSEASIYHGRRVSALDRLRVPVSYADLLTGDEVKDIQNDCGENEL